MPRRILSNETRVVAVSLVALLLLWETVPRLLSVPPYLFPTLSDAYRAARSVAPQFAQNFLTTAGEAVLGFLVGSLLGALAGTAMSQSLSLRRVLLPYLIGSNAIPVVAVAPLVVLWFGYGLSSKTILAAFLCFFPVTINAYRGLAEYDPAYQDLFVAFGATPAQFLVGFKIPNALPYLFSGLKLNATFAVIGAVVAEFVGASSGLGFAMVQATYSLNTPRLFAYLVVSCGLGLAMYGLVAMVEHIVRRRLGTATPVNAHIG